jgi:hypothetical protein
LARRNSSSCRAAGRVRPRVAPRKAQRNAPCADQPHAARRRSSLLHHRATGAGTPGGPHARGGRHRATDV